MSDEDTIRLDPEESCVNIGPQKEPIHIIPPKVRSEVCLNGDWGVVFRLAVSAPNRFHRLMHRLLFGIHWREVEDE